MWIPVDVELKRNWHTETPYRVKSSERGLYVHQGEIAYGIPERDFDCVGSDDATTCIILLCRHVVSGLLLVAHIDSDDKCSGLSKYIDVMVDDSHPEVDVYISGGILYMTDSMRTLQALFFALGQCEIANCQLRMLNYSKNCGKQGLSLMMSNQKFDFSNAEQLQMPKPYVKGCGFVMVEEDGEWGVKVLPMAFPLDTRGPRALIRQATTLLSRELNVVYSPCGGNLLRVKSSSSAKIFNLDRQTIDYFTKSCHLPTEDFLKEWSSSPHCEPPHFSEEMKQILKWIVDINRRGKKAVPTTTHFQLKKNEWQEVIP